MKKKLIYIALLAVSLTTASCNKYLDIQPVGTVVPTTEADFRALMFSGYKVYPEHKSFLTLRTDELLLDEFSTDLATLKDLYLWNDQNPDRNTQPMAWETFYKSIFYANHIIAEAKEKVGDTDAVKQIRAEAYLLRAYAHFELLNTYADNYNVATALTDRGVPISIKVDLEQLFAPATVEKVYQQILADMEEASVLLQVTDQVTNVKYRFSRRAYDAFEARLRLYRGEWELAAQAADRGLAINANLENLNDANSKLPNDFESKEMIQAWEEVGKSSVSSSTLISPVLLTKYDRGDLRLVRYFEKRWDDNIVSKKGGNNRFNVTFRNAELYLIKAETAARLGQTEQAMASLTTLLKNRLTVTAFATAQAKLATLSNAELITFILDERARELALEGLRWYDLKRTTRPEIVHSYQSRNYTLNENDPRYVIRYPKEAISNNPDL
ncbi:RagB/SusD family nutrient uptake outer membrane protein [Sphingobacterium sp. UDSM-2020]|uniref:RagB/SusD family nutrient uptake outer membrane protein n=1 Tax=Sphingobacterium sp. UDSM-2020 TaxID=2795738 RepID=UPI0019389EC5|nr:RagB/SusD family nutrient uptake outer membrane protein [Sphingobacterium sp. UDSM-2020]QQD15589.1 RagB/SusD family nutrient uptake outer membrane protein [Sphingobacterium sp. UDSM-2020]